MRRIIGLSGYAGSGKDSAGGILQREHGFRTVAFADGVRRLAERVDPLVYARDYGYIKYRLALDLYGYAEAKKVTTARALLVGLGAGVREVIGEDAWVLAVRKAIEESPEDAAWAITDVRYDNEARMIQALGGEVWMLDRPGVYADNEEEERSIAKIAPNAWLENTGDLADLEASIRRHLGNYYYSRGALRGDY